MPKLKFALPGDERYNTLMSLVALLQRVEEIHIDDLAKHFDLPKSGMRKLISTLNTTSFLDRGAFDETPFFIDVERIDEGDGMVSLDFGDDIEGVPTLTEAQRVAIVTGLTMLANIPDFEASSDLNELLQILANDDVSPEVVIDSPHLEANLSDFRSAILSNRQVSFDYVNTSGKQSTRTADPLVLINGEGHWYLRAFCHVNNEIRTFRLDHISKMEVLSSARSQVSLKAAEKDPDLTAIYSSKPEHTEIELELEPEAYRMASMFTPIGEPTRQSDNSVRVKITIGYLPDLGPLISRFGGKARVIAPNSAKKIVKDYAENLLGHVKKVAESE